jgi:hypothetical protein
VVGGWVPAWTEASAEDPRDDDGVAGTLRIRIGSHARAASTNRYTTKEWMLGASAVAAAPVVSGVAAATEATTAEVGTVPPPPTTRVGGSNLPVHQLRVSQWLPDDVGERNGPAAAAPPPSSPPPADDDAAAAEDDVPLP